MSKKSDDQSNHQSDDQPADQSQTEIHVESHAESHVSSSGAAPAGQLAELTADLQRLQAEFINYKRRAEAEKADTINFAKARIVREFLTVRDSFDQELAHRPAAIDPAWAQSIDSIRQQFDQVLKTLGVERFESQGHTFDPHLHEAIATDGDGDTVTAELQPGYKLGDTILRPALVKVGS
jgi:molecular chaperone GrpE